MMKRSSPLARRAPITRRRRKASETKRIYGGAERIAWIKAQPCVITGRSPCEAAHVKTGGTGRKADACWTVPMIPEKHRELHSIGIATFEAKYNVDLELAAIATEQQWLAHLARSR
jgi:hypothetical protein